MATVDIGGAGVGAVLLVGKLMDTLVAKGTITIDEREQVVRDALAVTGGDMEKAVKDTFKTVFPGLKL